MVPPYLSRTTVLSALLLAILCGLSGCGKKPVRKVLETTAYCGCSQCCGWTRGSWTYLKLDFWNRYTIKSGRDYTGQTASGTYPREPEEGFFSMDSIQRPWMIPVRLVFFPWYFLPEKGTIAADTRYFPFGTTMHIPGYGWGMVEDRGSAIVGPTRIDLYFDSHQDALEWGRRKLAVEIHRP
ncbi:MAG: 3D domain-containing protein [Thermodesulfobacteriota bacterium]